MSYKDYQNARDAAWRILLDCGVDRLPVNLSDICRSLSIRTYKYETARELIMLNGLTEIVKHTDGLAYYQDGIPVILYDGDMYPRRIRFTVSHEIGHIILRHVLPGGVTNRNREPQKGDSPIETAANQFAARILAPACVLWALDIHEPEDIEELCHISHQAAVFRAERMETLYKRGKFLASTVEQAVYRQFMPFIRAVRQNRA